MRHGFTLLELSIVLVIIGLIIGGITVGQELIRSSELQSVAKEFSKFQTAVNSFKLKYNAIPGDMDNAQDYWGVAHATPATCITTAGSGTETCNGDGDGIIETSTGSNERFRFWEHLVNSEIISGDYTGVTGAGGADENIINENIPGSAITGAGWGVSYLSNFAGDAGTFAFDYQNHYIYGAEIATSTNTAKILSPPDAQSIDNKIDDGMPGRGKLIALHWNDCTDATASTAAQAAAATYLLSDTTIQCGFYFAKAF